MNLLLSVSNRLRQTIAGAAWYHPKRQFAQSFLPIGPLEDSVHYLEDDSIATNHQQTAPLINISCAHEFTSVIRTLGNVNLVRSLRFRQDWMDPLLEGISASARS